MTFFVFVSPPACQSFFAKKYLRKSLVVTQIIANFAALKRAHTLRLIANSLRINAMGGLCEYICEVFSDDTKTRKTNKRYLITQTN